MILRTAKRVATARHPLVAIVTPVTPPRGSKVCPGTGASRPGVPCLGSPSRPPHRAWRVFRERLGQPPAPVRLQQRACQGTLLCGCPRLEERDRRSGPCSPAPPYPTYSCRG